MLRGIVERSIRHRGVVITLAVVLLAYGLWTVMHAKFDAFPQFTPPQAVIHTRAAGLSPTQVEALVTRPLEAQLNGVTGLRFIRSQSIQGLSLITLTFADDVDVALARQRVSERLASAAAALPAGLGPPVLAPLTSSTNVVYVCGLTSEQISPMALRTWAEWTLKPWLLSTPGVAKVVIYGGEEKQLQIRLRPERLLARGLTLDDVLAAARAASLVRPAGFFENAGQRITLRSEAQATEPAALGETVVRTRGGVPVRLADLGEVVEGPAPKFGDGAINGRAGVVLVVSSQLGANTLDVTRRLEAALDQIRPQAEARGIVLHRPLFRPADFIETALHNMRVSLIAGGVLVAGVLWLLLADLRTAVIPLTAIPLSLLAAATVLAVAGVTINTMTLGGLAIAIGEVVDDAIIDVENIQRRLHENLSAARPRPAWRVVLDASLEVRGAVVYATFIVALVFVPVLLMTGLQGRFFAPLGWAYILAILASLAVALTLTPALACVLLRPAAGRSGHSRLTQWLIGRYRRVIEPLVQRPRSMLALTAGLTLAAVAAVPWFGGEFLPEFRENNFVLHMAAAPGTSLPQTMRLGAEVSRTLLKNPAVRSVTQRAGRAELGDDIFGSHYAEFDVALKPLPGEQAERVGDQIRHQLRDFPGVYFALTPFLSERIEETLSGITAEVVVKLFGPDLAQLDEAAGQVRRCMEQIRGARDVQQLSPPPQPVMVLRLDRRRLSALGLSPASVAAAIEAAGRGVVVGRAFESDRAFDIAVRLEPPVRRDPELLGRIPLRTRDGRHVRLSAVVDAELTTGPYAVYHDGGRRFQAVTCNVGGRDVASFVAELRQRIARTVHLPAGVQMVFAGLAEAARGARRELLLHAAVVGGLIVALLALALGSGRNLLLVLTNLPFALAGGVLAVFAMGGWLSLGTLVGFVTLFGITLRNSIMLVSHYQHLVAVEGQPWNAATAVRGAAERLAPILMTAATTALGLLPLAIGAEEAGREIEGPMAIVILGGLLTSTALNLLVLPALALRYGRFQPTLQESIA